ncbi:MAG: ABC transporter ATP-binding protein [Lachnospiraceae bacterium]|nr:ABC transporter ATP-binding protein [Lachnospiraceae bacterium]
MSKKEYEHGTAKTAPRRGPGAGGPPGTRPGEKAKDFKGSIVKLLKYNKAVLPLMGVALVLSFLTSIFTIISPDKLKEMTAEIEKGLIASIDMQAIGNIAVFLVVIILLGAVFGYLHSVLMAIVTQRVSRKLRNEISEKINVLPLKYFDNTTFGDVLSRVTNDVDTVAHTLNQSATQLVNSITLFVGSLLMMLLTDLTMTITAIVSSLIGFVLMSLIMASSQKYFLGQQKYLGDLNGHVEEIYAGHMVMKAFNGQKKEGIAFDEVNKKLADSAFKAQFLSGLMHPIMGFVGNLGYVAVCVVGAILTINGKIDFAVIVAFIMYIRYFTQPMTQIAQAATNLQSTVAAAERVFEFLEAEEMEDESHKETILKGEDVIGNISFEHVKFGYHPDKIIIHDFSAQAKSGEKIAIVGPTGAGKTTLVNLLMRFYEVNEGNISIDGVPVANLTRENVNDLFGMVLQDTWLFEGTIRENIVYGKEGITDKRLDEVCKTVGMLHFIRTLPKGYDTVLNDKVNLSAGQKQLLTIARAMIEDAPMLILDEATSSVDTRTEVLIQEAMDRLMQGRTSFVIAHRLSTIRNADLILVMKDGDVIESGTHEALIQQNGFYAELYNSQFEKVG